MNRLLILLLPILFSSCGLNNVDFRNTVSSSEISIYLVKEGQLQIHSAEKDFDLQKLELERDPWIKPSDIEFYDWSSHTFYLKAEKEKNKFSGRHFVILDGKERLFAGVFFPLMLSSVPNLPSIAPEDGMFYPGDIIHFEQLGHQFTGNIEKQNGFKDALVSSGLFRNGIKVELTELKRKSTNSLLYTFQVTNLDKQTIYVMDPDKMECNFQHYTNGIWLKKDNLHYFPENTKICPVIEFNENWYYKLKPGEKITRIFERQGFNPLPTGKVGVFFSFPGAPVKKSGEWKKKDGRLWLGDYFIESELTIQ